MKPALLLAAAQLLLLAFLVFRVVATDAVLFGCAASPQSAHIDFVNPPAHTVATD